MLLPIELWMLQYPADWKGRTLLHTEKDICLCKFQILLLVLLSSPHYLELSTMTVTWHNVHSCDIVVFKICCLLRANLRSQQFGSVEGIFIFSSKN